MSHLTPRILRAYTIIEMGYVKVPLLKIIERKTRYHCHHRCGRLLYQNEIFKWMIATIVAAAEAAIILTPPPQF